MLMLSSIRLSETPWLIPCLQYLNKTILSYHTHTHTDIYIYRYIYISFSWTKVIHNRDFNKKVKH